MPDQDQSRLANLVDTAANQITQNLHQSLDNSISQALPPAVRQQWISSLAHQFAHQTIKQLGQTPNLERSAYQTAYRDALTNALGVIENHPLAAFIPEKTRQQLVEGLQATLNPQQAQEAALAAYQAEQTRAQKLTDSQQTAQAIHTQISEDKKYGLKQEDAEKIIKQIRNTPEVINNPSKEQVEKAIQDIVDDPQTTPATRQYSQELLKQSDSIHRYVAGATDPLPQRTPFTPFKPNLTPNTLRQAKSLNTSPLALAYAKAGFSATDPKLPKDIQQEVSRLQQIIASPFSPQNKLSVAGYLNAAKLHPQVFVAKNYYHPLYQTFQKTQVGANKVLQKPYDTYLNLSDTYQALAKKYQEYKTEKPIGWLFSPRYRTRQAVNNIKRDTKRWAKLQTLKTQKRRQAYRKVAKPIKDVTTLWDKWSPKGIAKRSKKWLKDQSINTAVKTGDWLIKKGLLKGFGKFLQSVGTLTAEGVALPAAFITAGFGIFKAAFRKFKQQREKDKYAQDTAGIGAKVFQTIFGALKSLGALILGSLWGVGGALAGAFIGFLVGLTFGPIGAAIGALAGFIGGGLAGTGLGALVGYNWMSIAAVPAAMATGLSGFFGALSGSTGATIAGTAAGVGLAAVGLSACQSQQALNTTTSAFFLPETENIPSDQGAFAGSGSCLIPENPSLLCASYGNPVAACQHGSQSYWQGQLCSPSSEQCQKTPQDACCALSCRWAIPILDKSCIESPYNNGTCYNPSSQCKYYGYAADFSYADGSPDKPVVLPEMNGKKLDWKLNYQVKFITGSGAGGKYVAQDGNNTYELYVMHLNSPPPSSAQSGQEIGTLFDFSTAGSASTPHVHVELKINGQFVRPEDVLCQ